MTVEGTKTEGILRISGNTTEVRDLKLELVKGEERSLSNYDVHTVSGVLKGILRELPGNMSCHDHQHPEPLCTFACYSSFLKTTEGASIEECG